MSSTGRGGVEAKTGLMLAHGPVTVQGSVPSAARAGLPMELWQQQGRSCGKLCFAIQNLCALLFRYPC